jgi:transposase
MPRCLVLKPHLAGEELERRYRASHDPVERSRWHMLWLIGCGHHVPAVATMTGYTENWIRTIIHRYNADGPEGVVDRRHANPGQPRLLTSDLREALGEALASPPPDGGLWAGRKVAAWMSAHLERPVAEPRGWEAMRALGFTPQRPRPRATETNPEAQAAFKKGGSPMR